MAIAAIIADDFSSATDCGVQFSSRGLETVALMAIPDRSQRLEYDVASIDTDSRAASAAIAHERVRRAAELVKNSGYRYIYKSIDSTLRGNLGAEIDAMLDVLRPEFAFVAPAFPYWGRTTINGYHFLDGVPISESQFSRDPVWPIREPSLVKLLLSQTKRRVGLIDIDGVRGEPADLSARLSHLKAQGKEIVVFDAATEEDLRRIARISATTGQGNLIVGSTGLSQYLADAWGISRGGRPGQIGGGSGPVIVVSASSSPTTRRQIEQYASDSDTFCLEIEARSIVGGGFQDTAEARDRTVQAAIDAGKDIAIYLDSGPGNVRTTQELGESRGLGRIEVSNLIVKTIAEFAAGLVQRNPVRGILLTGGDTAKAVCGRLGASGMRLLTEVEPGIPVGLLVGPHEVTVVTKAGAFGSDDALDKARRMLRGAN